MWLAFFVFAFFLHFWHHQKERLVHERSPFRLWHYFGHGCILRKWTEVGNDIASISFRIISGCGFQIISRTGICQKSGRRFETTVFRLVWELRGIAVLKLFRGGVNRARNEIWRCRGICKFWIQNNDKQWCLPEILSFFPKLISSRNVLKFGNSGHVKNSQIQFCEKKMKTELRYEF